MLACSQGMRVPLCQMLVVVWMGMRVEKLLQLRQLRIHNRVSRIKAACHWIVRWCVAKGLLKRQFTDNGRLEMASLKGGWFDSSTRNSLENAFRRKSRAEGCKLFVSMAKPSRSEER